MIIAVEIKQQEIIYHVEETSEQSTELLIDTLFR